MDVRKEFPLSSFYKEYADDPVQFEAFLRMYDNLGKTIDFIAEQTKKNYVFTTSETYRYIPFQILQLEDSVYKPQNIVSNDYTVKAFNLYDLSIQERIDIWNNQLTKKQKIEALDATQTFIFLSAGRDEQIDNKSYQIIDLSVCDLNGKEFVNGVDFVLEDNKIYLFNDLASKDKNEEIILKDIAVDFKTPEVIMGNNIPIKQPEFLTPNEYRELMQIFVHAALGGPIIKNLNNSFNSIPGLSGFEIIDKVSSKITTKNHLWATNEFEEPTKLNRFEFVLSTPFDVFFDSKKLKLIQDFVNKIKPTRTSMVVIPTMSKIEDRFLLNEQAKEAYKLKMYKGSPNRPIIEKITAEELSKKILRLSISNDYFRPLIHDAFYRADSGIKYDTGLMFSEFIKMYPDIVAMSTKKSILEKITLKETKPKIVIESSCFDKILAQESNSVNIVLENKEKIDYLGEGVKTDSIHYSDSPTSLYDKTSYGNGVKEAMSIRFYKKLVS